MEIARLTRLILQPNTQLVIAWYSNCIESEIAILTKLEFQLDTQLVFQLNWEWWCKIANDVKCSHRMWAGSSRCLSGEDGLFVRRGSILQTNQRNLQHSKNQKPFWSKILIKDICSIEESEIISLMMNLCPCLTFRNKHRGANPSNVQINYVEHY